MDITKLNLFQWCKFLKHLGKTIMFLFVAAIIGLAAFGTFDQSLVPNLTSSSPGVQAGYAILTIIYSSIVIMTFWSYIATMTSDPGTVPPGWHPFDATLPIDTDTILAERLIEESKKNYIQECRNAGIAIPDARTEERLWSTCLERPRFCKKCKAWKPPRSHHCSYTRRCVLKMDHYCVWVGNTVGLLNYKYFVLFLIYAGLGCIFSALLLIRPCISIFTLDNPDLAPLLVSFIAFVFTAAFSLALIGFVIMHLRLVAINQTTIEAYEKRPIKPWPFDKGTKGNFIEVFGRNPKLWCIPIMSDDHKRRLLSESLDTVGLPLPPNIVIAPLSVVGGGDIENGIGGRMGGGDSDGKESSLDGEVTVLVER